MLVLCRKVGEKIVIPGLGVELTVVEVRSGRAHLGILAPSDVPVYRQEVWQRLQTAAGQEADACLPRGGPGQRRLDS